MAETNPNSRLEAFCDGVFAIALTLLIIELKLPSTPEITNTTEFWFALKQVIPSILAFVLSFTIIFITWVNHHNILKLTNKSSVSFIYANGFLLLTVVFLPFPTALIGEHVFTSRAAPAVILYNSTLFLQAVSWILIGATALNNNLFKSERAKKEMQKSKMYAHYSCIVYGLFTILAWWFPTVIAIITVLLWIFWLIISVRIRHQEMD